MLGCPHTVLIVYRYLTKECMQQRPCCYYMGVASIEAKEAAASSFSPCAWSVKIADGCFTANLCSLEYQVLHT